MPRPRFEGLGMIYLQYKLSIYQKINNKTTIIISSYFDFADSHVSCEGCQVVMVDPSGTEHNGAKGSGDTPWTSRSFERQTKRSTHTFTKYFLKTPKLRLL